MTESAAATAKPATRLPALDVLRFVAAAAVMCYHFTYNSLERPDGSLPPLEAVTRHGYLGVELFFIISGFVILWSARGRTAHRFLRARILRLYPEFWVAVLVSALVFTLAPFEPISTLSAREVALNLTMVPQYLGAPYVDGVYWTLGVEIKFYALLFVAILLRQLRFIEWWLYAWVVTLLVAALIDVGPVVRSLAMYPYGSLFAAGGLFFLAFDSGWTASRAVGLSVAMALSAYFAVENMEGFVGVSHITPASQATTALLIIVMFATFALIVKSGSRLQFGSWAATAGALTYPLYLLHNTGKALFLRGELELPEALGVPLAMMFSLSVAYAVMWIGTKVIQPQLRRFLDALRIA